MWRVRLLMPLAVLGAVLSACGGDDAEPTPSGAGSAPGEVEIRNFEFMPETVTVAAGTTVTWTNRDDAPHTVKGDGNSFAESPQMNQGGTFRMTFDTAGRFPYVCGIHNYMRGTVVVT